MLPSIWKLHELTSLYDEALLGWLDLYEDSFPPLERTPVSGQLRALLERERSGASRARLFALLDELGAVQGMAQTVDIDAACAALLAYIAIAPERQGQGLGAALYRELAQRLRAAKAIRFWIFDVEEPEQMQSEAERACARRRIRFYERLGAQTLPGVLFAWGSLRQRLMFQAFAPDVAQAEIWACARLLAESSGGALVEETPIPPAPLP